MKNKEIFKELYSKKINKKQNYQDIIRQIEKGNKLSMNRMLKYAVIPLCLVLSIYIGIVISDKEIFKSKENIVGNIKVYAYQTIEETSEKRELKENIKLELSKYNKAMSSVPGYPIFFKLENIDYINIVIENGDIYDYNRTTGKVTKLEKNQQLNTDKTLYFNVDENTKIKMIGIKKKETVFEKNITFSKDSEFNYYALLK